MTYAYPKMVIGALGEDLVTCLKLGCSTGMWTHNEEILSVNREIQNPGWSIGVVKLI